MYDSAGGLACHSISANICNTSVDRPYFDLVSGRFVVASAESKI
jgi:hypothetical protein